MIAKAIEKLLELRRIEQREITGRNYTDRPLNPVLAPVQDLIAVHSLTGICDFLDTEPNEGAELHIRSEKVVALISPVFGNFAQRIVFIRADAIMGEFNFGQWYGLEFFIIALQTQFVQTETTAKLLAMIGNIADGEVRTLKDDGVTQEVNLKAGITRKSATEVPNPVTLAPYRTFAEITQPESPFVFRMTPGSDKPTCALFEADGQRWKLDAIAGIKAWFKKEKPDLPIIG